MLLLLLLFGAGYMLALVYNFYMNVSICQFNTYFFFIHRSFRFEFTFLEVNRERDRMYTNGTLYRIECSRASISTIHSDPTSHRKQQNNYEKKDTTTE